MKKRIRWLGITAVLLLLAAAAPVGAALAYGALHRDRIYPGVTVGGVNVGGLTVEEATASLAGGLPSPASHRLTLQDGAHAYELTWADVGQGYDYAASAQRAFQAARPDSWTQQLYQAVVVRWQGYAVDPVVAPANAEGVAAALKALAPSLFVPAIDARVLITAGAVTPLPGQPGRALDVETTTGRVLEALSETAWTVEASPGKQQAPVVELAFTPVEPAIARPEPAGALATRLLAQPFVAIAEDPPTDYYAEFDAAPTRMATWLRAEARPGGREGQLALVVDETPVRAWLTEVASQLGEGRLLDLDRATISATAALMEGQSQVRLRILHPPRTYTVQPGDYFFDIAYAHGFPQWQVERANPGLVVEEIGAGQQITIPSIDVLFPHPFAPGKRIEIDLPTQRLRAYENGELVYDFTCSSGMSKTPTLAGDFQIVFKEDNAYAKKWDLQMPYFMAFYEYAPDYFNGIHELPILSSGRRLWANVLGWPASYGCIILDIGDAEKLYRWAPVGTYVRVKGVAPGTPTLEERLAAAAAEKADAGGEGQPAAP